MKRFRGGLVFKAHRLVYHPTLGLSEIGKKKKKGATSLFVERSRLLPQESCGANPVGESTCALELSGLFHRLHPTFNVDLLRPFLERDPALGSPRQQLIHVFLRRIV